jgi:acetate kinase
MKMLVINSGSFSFKYKLFNEDFRLEKERNIKTGNTTIEEKFKKALEEIGDISEIKIVGHRVVHGGKEFSEPSEITPKNLEKLKKYNALAPLHNPYNLAGIEAALNLLPKVPSIAVFDTAFYKNLPEYAKIYALPLKYYKKGIQRFGFHGTSHKFVAEEAAKKLKKAFSECNLITIHLGGGCSITAIKKGKAIDTSMGFTPLEGLVMGTRTGDIDAGIIINLLKEEKLSEDDLDKLLNQESGIKGISGYTDFRNLLNGIEKGEYNAKLAFDVFIYRIKKYIGAYFAILNNIDAIIFTGAIGNGREITRNKIIEDIKILENVPIFAIETNEELAIAREIKKQIII